MYMEISAETRNKAVLLHQTKKSLEEKTVQLKKEVREMYEDFLKENNLDGLVKLVGETESYSRQKFNKGAIGKLKVVPTLEAKTGAYTGLPEIRFFEFYRSSKRYAGIGTGFDAETFRETMEYILRIFEPYEGAERIRERDRFDER